MKKSKAKIKSFEEFLEEDYFRVGKNEEKRKSELDRERL